MILKGSQRSGAKQLANHLLNARDNEHVELHDLRGFIADDLSGALQEAKAISRGTRCKQFMFSLSMNPPMEGEVDDRGYINAADRAEQALGLASQPRAIVFHEKDGRRHAHVVWSRINPTTMTAINLSHFKHKLTALSRDLFLEHGWNLPKGLQDKRSRDPLSFSLKEWQQARRTEMEPKLLKAMFADIWTSTKGVEDLRNALAARGFLLAKGDRRGHVALDFKGEVYALGRWMPVKTKEVRARLGDPGPLPSIEDTKQKLAEGMGKALQGFVKEIEQELEIKRAGFLLRKDWMVQKHRAERKALSDRHEKRWEQESQARAARLPRGLKALWSWLKGEYQHLRLDNQREVEHCQERDLRERAALFGQHKEEFRGLREELRQFRELRTERLQALRVELARCMEMGGPSLESAQKLLKSRQIQGPRLGL